MADSLDMHRKLQQKRRALSTGEHKARESAALVLFPVPNAQKSVHPALLEMEMRHQEEMAFVKAPVDIDIEDALEMLEQIHDNYSQERLSNLLIECRTSIISTTANAFGLGSVVAGYDKHGGNVTTVHNAHNNVYAREDIESYKRGDYTKPGDTESYRDKNTSKDFTIVDEYTGVSHYYKDENNRSSVDADHIVATSDYHRDGGFIQSKADRREFGKDEANMAIMLSSANKSKGDKGIDEWLNGKNTKDPSKTNAEFYGVNKEKALDIMERGRRTAESHAPTKSEWVMYYSERLAVTGAVEAGKMGLQQAMGLLLTNLFDALFSEIKDIYSNGFVNINDNDAMDSLKKRAKTILEKVVSDWRSVVTAFRDGAISGFISNILTVFVNSFITTAKNIVRMIREGFFSLFKAIKLILFHPEEMTWKEACDAALKLVAAGVITIAGIGLEEVVRNGLTGVPFAETIVMVLVGGMTGIASALAVYAIDDLDLFGVRSEEKHQHVMAILESAKNKNEQELDLLFDRVMSPVI